MKPFESLSLEQKRRFGQVVDSRTRLLGEGYSRAYDAVQADGGGNEEWILHGPALSLDDVIRWCDCWSERALRNAPVQACRPANHDLSCPVNDKEAR